jgi:D-serine deaminase-like pyridoxal phosphate-dependent protein
VNRGERVALIPGHLDPTMDRYEVLHMVRGDTLVDIVKVEGRGRSQ